MPLDLDRQTDPKTLAHIERQLARDPRLKSEKTRAGYLTDLSAFERWRDERRLTKLLVEEYAAQLQGLERAPNSINRVLAAIRWWARRVADLAREDNTRPTSERQEIAEQALRVAEIENVKGKRAKKGRHIEAGELAALMRACRADPSPAGVRDAALIALAWNTGLRVSELAELQLANVKELGPDEYELTVTGKGDKARNTYVYDGAAAALADWLHLRGNDGPAAPVFVAVSNAGEIQREPKARGLRTGGTILKQPGIGANALNKMLERRAAEAELSQPITWHDFRRSFAGNLLDGGIDLATVQKLMGHSSPITTSEYDRRGEEVKKRAVRTLYVPYKRQRGKPMVD